MTNIYFESVLMAWSSIVSNKMRSLLTMLGIIIGVAAVIALMSIGYGVQDSIKSDISRLGSNTITVTPGTGRKPGVKQAAGSMQTLTYKDYLAIRNLPNITYSAPLVQGSYLLVNGNKNWNTRVYGCTQDYADLSDLKVQEGRFWTQKEYNARARVAVIGKTVATGLFGEEDPIGKKVRIHGNPFTVIGLLEEKGYSFMDQDDRVLCPFSTVQEGCLDRPTRGSYKLDGEEVARLGDSALAYTRNRKIGFVFQSFNLLPKLSALDNVILPMIYGNVFKKERRERALRMLDSVGLGDRAYHMPAEMSGGQRQRVAIARALINDPAILMADEPTGNLDSKSTKEVMEIFSSLYKEGKTIILVTHENDVAAYATRHVILSDGHISKDIRGPLS